MEAQWGLRQTYLEVRLLVDDLKLVPKDPPPPPPQPAATPQAAAPAAGDLPARDLPPSKVRVTVDQVTRVGAMASGKVKFSDNKTAEWYLDQMGGPHWPRRKRVYKPTAADLQDFQMALKMNWEARWGREEGRYLNLEFRMQNAECRMSKGSSVYGMPDEARRMNYLVDCGGAVHPRNGGAR